MEYHSCVMWSRSKFKSLVRADSAPGSTKTTPRQLRIPRSATATMNDKAEVPVDEKTEV